MPRSGGGLQKYGGLPVLASFNPARIAEDRCHQRLEHQPELPSARVIRAIRSWTRRVHVSSRKSITFLSLRRTWLTRARPARVGPPQPPATGTACFQWSRTATTRKMKPISTADQRDVKERQPPPAPTPRPLRRLRARQHRRRDEVLRRPHNLRRDPGEQVDEHASCGGGEEAHGRSRRRDSRSCSSALCAPRIANHGRLKDLPSDKHPCAEPLFLGLRPAETARAPAAPSGCIRTDKWGAGAARGSHGAARRAATPPPIPPKKAKISSPATE